MPMPAQRRGLDVRNRVNKLKEAGKQWNHSYWTSLSWSDIAWGAGTRVGSIAYTLGKAVSLDLLKGATLGALSVDTCSAVGTFGAMCRDAVGNLAAYASSDEADKLTGQSVDLMWGNVTDYLMGGLESAVGSAVSGKDARARASSASRSYSDTVTGFDPAEAMPEIKNLFIDTLVTIAELNAISNAATQSGRMPFQYCDDAHAMWAKFHRVKNNVETLKEHCDNLKTFADRAKQTVTDAHTGMLGLENSLTDLTERAIDSGAINHYAGGGVLDFRARMGQCSHVKCYGPA